jgi:hypothetical protein
MKKLHSRSSQKHAAKTAACTVSAAALMLGVSEAATIGINFQADYCGTPSLSGYIVTTTAFGIPPSGWENLTQMMTGYGSAPCDQLSYSLSEVFNTTTSDGSLNPLPNGSVTVNWTASTANVSGFSGGYPGNTGEFQVYHGFLRDGVNFGPGSSGGDNNQPGYNIDITGLKTLFTNSPFVVQLIAGSDSMQYFTNAFVIDAVSNTTNSVSYPSPDLESPQNGVPWVRGYGGGLSTVTAVALNTDHIKVIGNRAAHGGDKTMGTDYNLASTISGIIITDKPVVSMSPQSVKGNPGDSVALSMYAAGVPPLAYQWRKNGHAIPGATTNSYNIASLGLANEGNYDVVVTNAYGSATSRVSVVTGGNVVMTPIAGLVVDSQPANPERDGINQGATWLASSSDGTINRSGVMSFVATNNTGISVTGATNFDGSKGTISFWMRSAGIDPNASGTVGAAVFGRPAGSLVNEFVIAQQDGGTLLFNAPTTANVINSSHNISDNLWHQIVLTYDGTISGGCALYIDGVLDITNANTAAWTATVGAPLQLGFTTGGTLRAYNGLLDDVRVYNRQLTPAEVTSLFNTGALIDTAALQMELNFDTAPVNGFSLTWNAVNSVLQSNGSISGAFSDVPGAISPYNIVPKVGGQKYYQFRYPSVAPQARVSNPFLM